MDFQLISAIGLSAFIGLSGLYLFFKINYLKRCNDDLLRENNHITSFYKKKIGELEKEKETLASDTKIRPQSIELKEFLGDLLTGDALIGVHRINSDHLFTFSPREKQ